MLHGRIRLGATARYVVRRTAGAERVDLLDRAPWLGGRPTGETVALVEEDLLWPCEPTKIVCIARNYREHAAELANPVPAEPLLFLKPPSALNAPGGTIRLPRQSERVDPEAEVALVIGRRLGPSEAPRAAEAIFGYTAMNDVTARDLQQRDRAFARAKGFDGFAPLGPFIVPGLPPATTAVVCRVNGRERQRATVADQIFDPVALASFVARVMTLEPGDVISTGTPAGVAPIGPGDRIEVEVDGVGILVSHVARGEPS